MLKEKSFSKVKRVPLGIPQLDNLISGGVKKNSINLVAGGPGTGKTIFAMQFLKEGIEKFNESCIYITFEERKEKTYEDMLEFGWDFAKYEKEGKFVYLEYTPEQVKKILVEGGGIVEAIIEKIKAKRLVIDSITSFSLLYQDELTKKEASLALFQLINNWDCTAVLTSQDTSPQQDTISAALEFEADSIIILYHLKIGGERKRAIEILKMRGTKIPEKTFALKITNKGIEIDTKQIITFKWKDLG
jgi:circadian clock protein KaiC